MALQVNATTKYLSKTSGACIDHNAAYTVACWARVTNTGTSDRPILFQIEVADFSKIDRLVLDWFGGAIQEVVSLDSGGGTSVTGTTGTTVNTWYYFAGRRNSAASLDALQNSAIEATNTTDVTGRATATRMSIGATPAGSNGCAVLEIAYLKAWSAIRSDAEIAAQKLVIEPLITTNLFCDLRMQSGALGTDSSVNANHFTVNGTPSFVSDPPGVVSGAVGQPTALRYGLARTGARGFGRGIS